MGSNLGSRVRIWAMGDGLGGGIVGWAVGWATWVAACWVVDWGIGLGSGVGSLFRSAGRWVQAKLRQSGFFFFFFRIREKDESFDILGEKSRTC
jgi:hypothetical protein